jgi:hypothetical protein
MRLDMREASIYASTVGPRPPFTSKLRLSLVYIRIHLSLSLLLSGMQH